MFQLFLALILAQVPWFFIVAPVAFFDSKFATPVMLCYVMFCSVFYYYFIYANLYFSIVSKIFSDFILSAF